MHLVIVTSGSRGDVQPYLALALRAARAGHRVTLATHAPFEAWVTSHGIAFRPLHGDPVAMLSTPGARAWMRDGSLTGLRQFVLEFRREFRGLTEGLLRDLITATADADFVVHSAVCMAAAQFHESRGIPVMGGWLAPLTPTQEFPGPGISYRSPASWWARRVNVTSHLIAQHLLWQPTRRIVNRWRGTALGLPRLPALRPFAAQQSASYPLCYAYSPSVLPRPSDWPAWISPSGWWYLDEPAYEPPASLASFLAAGERPVTIGFGSMTPQDGEWLTQVVLGACERAECRVVMLKGWGTLGETALPSWAHVQTDVPHSFLYARSHAVVHHGGAGSTGASVRAGVPTMVVPLGFDQQFWGSRLHAMGVAPAPIKRRDLTVANLAAALRATRENTRMRDQAAALGEAVRAEDGTAVALARIEEHFANAR
jgi:sterol 3beta-glucosyltransferase